MALGRPKQQLLPLGQSAPQLLKGIVWTKENVLSRRPPGGGGGRWTYF